MSAAILIGGRARRLQGAFKPGLRVGNQTILQRQLTALRAAGVDEVMVIGRAPAPMPDGLRHLPDVIEDSGPLAAVYSALIASTQPVVVILAGDLPFVPADLVRRLADLGADEDAAVPYGGGRWHPLCAAYRRRVALSIKGRIDRGELRVVDALTEMRVRAITLEELASMDPAGMSLTNVNTPDEHANADRLARTTS